MGILYSILAGLFISLQGVFNARVGEKIGGWPMNAIVHGTGLFLVLMILSLTSGWRFDHLGSVNRWYLAGGVLGVFIILFVMKGITGIGVSYASTIIIVTQILVTTTIQRLGLFGEPILRISPTQIAGLMLLIAGVLLYQWK